MPGSSELLDRFSLGENEKVLTLTVDTKEKALLTEQVEFRLKKLASKLNMEHAVT